MTCLACGSSGILFSSREKCADRKLGLILAQSGGVQNVFHTFGRGRASAWLVWMRENVRYRLCEGTKVVEFVMADIEHNLPINLLVVVHDNISETNGPFHAVREVSLEDIQVLQGLKSCGHGGLVLGPLWRQ